MKPYPEYKETGLSWLPKIPKHWEVVRTKSLFRLVVEAAPINNDYELLSVYSHIGVRPRRDLEAKGNRASTTDGYWIVKKGDIICNKLLAWMGAIGVSHYDGVTSPAYDIIRRRNEESEVEYYHYLFRTPLYQSVFRAFSKGIMDMRLRLYFDQFGTISIPCPPIAEQKKIVRYLDLMAAKIDTLIDAKKKQIALLQEKKQAIVNQVVTRGLNPDVQLKDSGIDWLGKIPAHWEIRPLKYFVESNLKSLSQDTDDDFSFSYIDISSVGYGYIRAELEQMRFADAPSRARRLVSVGDTIISTVRTHLRSICLIDENLKDCVVSTGFSVLHPSKHVHSQILNFVLSTDAFINSVIQNSIGISYPAIADSRLLSLKIALPPSLGEQEEIVKYIENEIQCFDKAQKVIDDEIKNLQEYRICLVSAVVTGMIDIFN